LNEVNLGQTRLLAKGLGGVFVIGHNFKSGRSLTLESCFFKKEAVP
jgi:hypothetical protein